MAEYKCAHSHKRLDGMLVCEIQALKSRLALAEKVCFWANEYRTSMKVNCDSGSRISARAGLDKALSAWGKGK